MPTYIDIHTHRNNNPFPAIINTFEHFDKLDEKRFYSIGIHPCKINSSGIDEQMEEMKKAMYSPNVLAIGECGLDNRSGTDSYKQQSIFIRQIEIANECNKPLIIHCVKAHEDLIRLLLKHKCKVPVLIHGFNNKFAIAEKYLNSGCFLSFGSSIFKETQSDVLKKVPLEKIFFETDDSELEIEMIYKKGSMILGIEMLDLMLQIQKNASNLLLKNILPWKI